MRSFKLSYAGPEDAALLASHRQRMWLDIHPEWRKEVRESKKATQEWIKKELARGRLIGFIVRANGRVAGSGCIWLREEQPRPTSTRLEVPYLMSMYTARAYRRRGVATLIVKRALKWCSERGYDRVVLHASKDGRVIYESLGFEQANEMRYRLRSRPN